MERRLINSCIRVSQLIILLRQMSSSLRPSITTSVLSRQLTCTSTYLYIPNRYESARTAMTRRRSPKLDGGFIKPYSETRTIDRRKSLKRATKIVVAMLTLVVILGAAVAYYFVKIAPQPNMQVTALNSGQPAQTPLSQQVQNQGRVPGSATFSYTANLKGSYYLTFDNTFSFFSSKYVVVSYTVADKQYNTGVSLRAGETKNIYVGLDSGGQVTGTFSTTGGSGNDVNFSITGNTCSETIPFSFMLVNSGPVSGYVNVAYQSDGSSLWTNKYFVASGQQLPVSGSVSLSDCDNHAFSATVTAQQKA